MCNSFRLHPFAVRNPARYRFGCGENKQRGIGRRRMEEGRQIDQEVRHEFKRTGDVIHGLASLVAHDERVRGQWPGAVGTWFPPTPETLPAHTVLAGPRAYHRSSVGNGLAVDKRVSHGSLPIFAHYVMR